MNLHSSTSFLARLTALGCIPSAPSDLTALGLFPIYSSTSSSGTFPHIIYLLSAYQFHLNNLLYHANEPQTKLNTDCYLGVHVLVFSTGTATFLHPPDVCLDYKLMMHLMMAGDFHYLVQHLPSQREISIKADNNKHLLSQNHGMA